MATAAKFLEALCNVAAASSPAKGRKRKRTATAKAAGAAAAAAPPAKQAKHVQPQVTEDPLPGQWHSVCAISPDTVAIASERLFAYKMRGISEPCIPIITADLNADIESECSGQFKAATSLVFTDGNTVLRGLPNGFRVRTAGRNTVTDVHLPGDAMPVAVAVAGNTIFVATEKTLLSFGLEEPHELQRESAEIDGMAVIAAIASDGPSVFVLLKSGSLYKIAAATFLIESKTKLREMEYVGLACGGGKLFIAIASGVVCVDRATWTALFTVIAPGLRAISATAEALAILSGDCLRTVDLKNM